MSLYRKREPGSDDGRVSIAMRNAASRPLHRIFRSRSSGRPEKCVSSWRTVMPSLPFPANSGRNAVTGSLSLSFPCSTSCITAVAVTMHLVSDATSKMVSAVIASRTGSSERIPKALR